MSNIRNYNHLIRPTPATSSILGNQQHGSSSNRSLQQLQEELCAWDYYFNPVPFHLMDQYGSHGHHNNFQPTTSQQTLHGGLGAPAGGVWPVQRRVNFIRPAVLSLTGFQIPERPSDHFFNISRGTPTASTNSNLHHQPTYSLRGTNFNHLPAPEESSKLSKQDQEKALKKLKKQVYSTSKPKAYIRRLGLYYRDLARPSEVVVNNNYNKDAQLDDQDGNNCAVCLDEFEHGDEVMVTPCNHMFHEHCIVPWVKSNGQCPVCRTVFADKMDKGNNELAGSVRNGRMDHVRLDHDVLSRQVLSIIRAAENSLALRIT